MRAQGYDGAAKMAGIHRGVQAIIRHPVADAVYVHCKAHSLNLAIGHAYNEPLVRNMLGPLQHIASAFHYSAKRLLSFQECLSQDAAIRVEMERRAKLRTLCETRWASRADSLYTFRTAFSVVVQALESLAENGDAKARGYDFIIALCATEHCLFKYSRCIHHASKSIYQPRGGNQGVKGNHQCIKGGEKRPNGFE